jgi:hypothetical protein
MFLIIHLLVPAEPLKIIICLLHHSYKQHKHQRSQVCYQESYIYSTHALLLTHSQKGDQLTQSNQQEKQVEEEFKLIVQN